MILALTITQLGCGLLLVSLMLHRSEVGVRLLQLLGAIAALALLPWGFTDLVPGTAGNLLLAGAVATLAWFVALPRAPGGLTLLLRVASTALASAGLVEMSLAFERPGISPATQGWLLGADAITSALLLGATMGAMLLGHWYLVTAGMSVGPLLRLTAVMGLACLSKVGTTTAALLLYGWPPAPHGWMMLLFVPPGLFYVIRLVLGLAGPLALTPLVWKTTRIQSTQSATGILYASVVLVLIGELTANFLLILTPLPF
jgi:hypothetical protein